MTRQQRKAARAAAVIAPPVRAPQNQTEVDAAEGRFSTSVNAVKDMYSNPISNTGAGTSSAVNGGFYFPYRISLDYITLLSLYRGSWICRAVIDTIPEDMLKTFPTITSEIDPEQLNEFNKAITSTATLQKLIEGMKWGRLFGGAIGIMILAGDQHRDLSQPLKLEDVDPGSYRGLIIVDRWSGVSPSAELISNIENPSEYGLPVAYQVTTEVSQTFVVHHSRVLRFTGRDLPL